MPPGFNDLHTSVAEAVSALDQAGVLLNSNDIGKSAASSRSLCRIVTDSRLVKAGDIFVAFKGGSYDAHDSLNEVANKNPALIILENAEKSPRNVGCPVLAVSSGRQAWSYLCSAASGYPQSTLKLIGVTGTNGKTSTVWHLRHLFAQVGVPVLSIGTLGAWLGEEFIPTTHTTPDPPVLYSLFKRAVEHGISYVVMEVSSHAIYQEKVAPLRFSAGIFTSFSRDHLDLHGDMDSYFKEKCRLFTELCQPDMKVYVSSSLSERLPALKGLCPQATLYGFKAQHFAQQFGFSNYTNITLERTAASGSNCVVSGTASSALTLSVPVVGEFAIENLLVASLTVSEFSRLPLATLGYEKLRQVPGRLELVPAKREGNPLTVVDYAHTPDALTKALEVLRPLTRGRLWVVFGCGGDRDRGKRPLMGRIAIELADKVIVTSDNPRFEDPKAIIDDIIKGIPAEFSKKVKCITDRREAITFAVTEAGRDDVLLIAGKGAEDYLDIKGQKIPFDDRKSVSVAMQG